MYQSKKESNLWMPTMNLRWKRRCNLHHHVKELDVYKEVLQQQWISETGDEEWRDIEVYSE